ncbi:MAG TPA: VOC family protein [Thermoplasmata archaeon]|nr:VOC family protein [Thermoplasmata archaeon]
MPRSPLPRRAPRRLFVRVVRYGAAADEVIPKPHVVRDFLDGFDRVGRLVAHGPLVDPAGDFLLFRATDRAEAARLLRRDPMRELPGSDYQLLGWSPGRAGVGVVIDPPPARGSGRITLVQRVPVVVRDQERAIAWYRDVLGLSVVAHDPDTHYVELALGPGAVALSLIAPRPEWGEPEYSETLARLGISTGIVFQTDSVDALALRLEHAHARITRGVEQQPWGERTIRFADPDGNEFLAFDRRPATARPGDAPTPRTESEDADGSMDGTGELTEMADGLRGRDRSMPRRRAKS